MNTIPKNYTALKNTCFIIFCFIINRYLRNLVYGIMRIY